MSSLKEIAACITAKRLVNLLLNETGYYISALLKKPVLTGFPWAVSIETNNTCNLRCPECPTGTNSLTRNRGVMSLEFFGKIIEELESTILYLTLYFQGEPLLNPDFFEMVKLARKKRIYVSTSTNGHLLSAENARLAVESGLNRMIVSIDGTDPATYSAYRIGGDLEKVKEGISKLIAWKKNLGSPTPFIEIQFLVLGTNEHQMEEMERLSRKLGADKLTFKTAQIMDYRQGSSFIPNNYRYSRYRQNSDGTWSPKLKPVNRCHRMWRSAVITWEGAVVPCCFDKDALHEMGRLKDTSFRRIWNEKQYNEFRKQLLTNRKSISICENCTEGLKL